VPAAEEAAYEESSQAAAEAPANESRQISVNPMDAPQLAYDYDYTLSAEENRLNSLMQTHQNACLMAGTTRCQIISSEMSDNSQSSYGEYRLSLRASPEWIRLFRNGLEEQMKTFGGQIVSQGISGEDLSPEMVDTQSHITNKTALRDRLQQVVRTHNGKIKDLITAENQLSEVQDEIDAAKSQLKLMQKRVVMTKLTLRYQANSITGTRGVFRPLAQAIDGVVPILVTSLSMIIYLLAFLLPVAVIGVPVALWLRANKRRKLATTSVENPTH
jgi:DNA repair ATPase RecN